MTAVLAPVFVAPQGVSNHAAEQYQARVKPMLDLPEARKELLALLTAPSCRMLTTTPKWVRGEGCEFARHYEISDGIVIPVSPAGTAVTCLVRGLRPRERRAKKRHRDLTKRINTRRRTQRPSSRARQERTREITWE